MHAPSLRALAAAALVLLPVPTLAQSDPLIYCGPGAPFCFALRYAFGQYQGPLSATYATTFTVWLQNLQGSYPARDTNAPAPLSSFWIARENGPAGLPHGLPDLFLVAEQTSLQAEGAAGVGTASFPDRFGCPDAVCTLALVEFPYLGVAGCAVYDPIGAVIPPEDFYAIRTCPAQGLNGWARMTFVLGLRDGFDLDAPPMQVDFDMFAFGIGGPFQSHACVFGGDQAFPTPPPHRCAARPYLITDRSIATPEPATLALLLLPVLGIVAYRRRA